MYNINFQHLGMNRFLGSYLWRYVVYNYLHDVNLFQLVDEPTRITEDSASPLDLIITDQCNSAHARKACMSRMYVLRACSQSPCNRCDSQIKIAHIRPQPRKNCNIISECRMLLSKLLKTIYQKSTRIRGAEIGAFPWYATDTAIFSF